MVWSNFAGIGGRPKLGRRKSTNVDSVEPSEDTLDGVRTSEGATAGTGVGGVADGTVGVSPAAAEGGPEASQLGTGACTPDRVPVSPENMNREQGDLVNRASMCRFCTLGVAIEMALEDQLYAAPVCMIGSCLDIDGSKVQGRIHSSLTGT